MTCGSLVRLTSVSRTAVLASSSSHAWLQNCRRVSCRGVSTAAVSEAPESLSERRRANAPKLAELPEVVQRQRFAQQLAEGSCARLGGSPDANACVSSMGRELVLEAIWAGMATLLLHAESRVASACGKAFYTIGPCGEESLAPLGQLLEEGDSMALHYRHLAIQIARQLRAGTPIQNLILDRARGYCISRADPVTGGVHCALGGGPRDFVVTSTLASQAPTAVGRALAGPLADWLGVKHAKWGAGSVSFVSLGDGSVNNGHFLSAVNAAAYAVHRGFKCPVLFAISDNGLSISLRNYEYLPRFVENLPFPRFECDGRDLAAVHSVGSSALDHVRRSGKPAVLVLRHLPRRFGHAGTDRQAAYLTPEEIVSVAAENPLEGTCAAAVDAGFTTYEELSKEFTRLGVEVEQAFDVAAAEPKVESREEQCARVSAPLATLPPSARVPSQFVLLGAPQLAGKDGRRAVMRKQMTRAISESLSAHPDMVYIGEDVEHGGYYLVTDGLKKAHPGRVRDWPPDETSLIGLGVGMSQAGLLPIVEIPYAKYLDCGADAFFEAVIMHWLTDGKQPNGMIIRLQGFDRGVFGGNFHTHNALHRPPGLDVLVFSNGADWVRGWRHAVMQARAGRVVMVVDSTELLNARHIDVAAKDDALLTPYPPVEEILPFDGVRLHSSLVSSEGRWKLGIVTYGNGVVTALRARNTLVRTKASVEEKTDTVSSRGIFASWGSKPTQPSTRAVTAEDIVVIDTPCISATAPGDALKAAVQRCDALLFADVCKEGQGPLAHTISALQREGMLPGSQWHLVGAQPTYNPLGSYLTFLNEHDVTGAAGRLLACASR